MIEDIIAQQEKWIIELDMFKLDHNSQYLNDAVLYQILSRQNLIAFTKGFKYV